MYDLLMSVWFSFNVIFGLWTFKNIVIKLIALFRLKSIKQSAAGRLLDLVVMTSILTFFIYGG